MGLLNNSDGQFALHFQEKKDTPRSKACKAIGIAKAKATDTPLEGIDALWKGAVLPSLLVGSEAVPTPSSCITTRDSSSQVYVISKGHGKKCVVNHNDLKLYRSHDEVHNKWQLESQSALPEVSSPPLTPDTESDYNQSDYPPLLVISLEGQENIYVK